MNAATFTNVHGHINNGIVLEEGANGLIQVLWDDFPELERLILERKSRLNAADERSSKMRVSWVDTSRGHTTVAPLNGQKFYNRRLQAAIKSGNVDALAEAVIDKSLKN